MLRTREYGESDKIVTVLSRAEGKFSGIAKGAKRSQRRFPGTLEVFSHVTLDYKRRPHSELAFLDRAVLLLTFMLTVAFDLTIAIEVGVVLAAFLFMHRMSEWSRSRTTST